MAQATQQPVESVSLQGVLVPSTSVNPTEFYRRTRRGNFKQESAAWPGHGSSVEVQIRQAGIISMIRVRFVGTVVATLGGGTMATSWQWPYNLMKRVRFSANGQTNLINASGWQLKAREFMGRSDCNDRGVARGIGGASPGTSRTQGTLSLNSESWGLGQNVSAVAGAPTTYNVDISLEIPIAFDQVFLHGAIFAQTSSTDLILSIDTPAAADLFTLTGAATAVVDGTFIVEGIVYDIPLGPDGNVLVPDLSNFHSIIATPGPQPIAGANEVKLSGQGVGRQLMRLWFQVINGSTPAPLPMTQTNFGQIGWRYGGNTTPEVWNDGTIVNQHIEGLFGSDFGSYQGFGVLDWASEHALRDTIDEGSATELRLLYEIASGVTLASPRVDYVQETMFSGAVAA